MKILHDGKAIIVGLEYFNPDDYPLVKVIGCNMTSCEHLPLAEMEKRGIKLISLKGHDLFLSTVTSTAEHTVGLMIALLRNYKIALHGYYEELPNGLYNLRGYKDREEYKGHTLSGKILGIIGYDGRIGKQMIKRAEAFDMKVIGCDKH